MNPITKDLIQSILELPFEVRQRNYYTPEQIGFFLKQNSNCSPRNFLRFKPTFDKIWETKKVVKFPSGGTSPRAIRNAVNGAYRWITATKDFENPWFKEEYTYTDDDLNKLVESINEERISGKYSKLAECTITTIVLDQTYLRIKKRDVAIIEPVDSTIISDQQFLEEVSGVERESFQEIQKKIISRAASANPGEHIKFPTALSDHEVGMLSELLDTGLGEGIIGSAKNDVVLLYRKEIGE